MRLHNCFDVCMEAAGNFRNFALDLGDMTHDLFPYLTTSIQGYCHVNPWTSVLVSWYCVVNKPS